MCTFSSGSPCELEDDLEISTGTGTGGPRGTSLGDAGSTLTSTPSSLYAWLLSMLAIDTGSSPLSPEEAFCDEPSVMDTASRGVEACASLATTEGEEGSLNLCVSGGKLAPSGIRPVWRWRSISPNWKVTARHQSSGEDANNRQRAGSQRSEMRTSRGDTWFSCREQRGKSCTRVTEEI